MSDIDGALIQPGISKSGEVDSLLIEKFTGKVHEVWEKTEGLMGHFDAQSVTGTNMISNKFLGDTELQVLQPGQDPPPTDTEFDKNALVVDTTVIGRNYVQQLHDVQNDIDGLKSKLAKRQVTKIKRLEDEMIIQQLLYGALNNFESADAGADGGRTAPRVSGHGYSILVDISDAQAIDPYTMLASIEEALEQMVLQEMEVDEVTCVLPWTYWNVLNDAEMIQSKDYELVSGKTISGFKLKSYNVAIIPSNRFPKVANDANNRHLLSRASNNYRYDATATMLTAVACLFTYEALLLGYTLEIQGDIWLHKGSKGYFIDSWLAEGAIPDRWEACAAVFKGGSENTTIKNRAARKAQITRAVSL